MLALSKANKVFTTGSGLQKTTKWVKDWTPNLAKASAHWLASGRHESRACLGFVLLHSSIYIYIYFFFFKLLYDLEKILNQIFFNVDVQMKTSRKMERIHFYFYEFYEVQTTRLLAKPRSLACIDKEKLLYSENCLFCLGFFGGSYFQWLCGLVEWQ